jgi:hypothetical protein
MPSRPILPHGITLTARKMKAEHMADMSAMHEQMLWPHLLVVALALGS